MILSKGRKIVDFHGKGGTQLQKVFGKGGVLLWERGGLPQPPDGVVLTDIRVRVFMTQDERGYDGRAFLTFLKLSNTVDGLIWIDWGDGTAITYGENGAYNMSHIYTMPGEYIIHIKCRMQKSNYFLDLTENSYATEILPKSHLGTDYKECVSFLSYHSSDYDWCRITRFPDGFFDYCINIERLESLVNCNQSFDYIQPGVFKNLNKIKWMSGNFCDIPNLTTIPDNLYPHPNIYTNVSFAGTPIRKIPHGIATVHPFIGVAFSEFTRPGIPNVYIDEIPADYFNCVSSIATLNTIDGVFADLTMVTDIPPTIFHCIPKVTGFVSTFARSGITSIPQNLFANNPNVTDFRGTFDNCISVTSPVPRLWETHPNANGTDCFRGCVNAANYSEIPDIWK